MSKARQKSAMRADEAQNRGYINFVELIDDHDKAHGRRWRFIIYTIVVCSIAAIYLTNVIVERISTPRFPSINALVPSTATSEIQVFASPTEASATTELENQAEASPTIMALENQAEASPTTDMQATQRQAMLDAINGRR
jgi:hypothetical protein